LKWFEFWLMLGIHIKKLKTQVTALAALPYFKNQISPAPSLALQI
jgi:hypothetical protein